jgi:hypothetical protein
VVESRLNHSLCPEAEDVASYLAPSSGAARRALIASAARGDQAQRSEHADACEERESTVRNQRHGRWLQNWPGKSTPPRCPCRATLSNAYLEIAHRSRSVTRCRCRTVRARRTPVRRDSWRDAKRRRTQCHSSEADREQRRDGPWPLDLNRIRRARAHAGERDDHADPGRGADAQVRENPPVLTACRK